MLRRLTSIALRNAKRHKAQAIAAAAAIAVSTTVLAAALLAGGAAQAGITEIAYDVLGQTDQMVRSEGDFFFPEPAAETFHDEVHQRRADVQVSPTILHAGIATSPDGLTEPDTMLVGTPPDEAGFGGFHALEGTTDLNGTGVLVNEAAAEPLELSTGDTLTMRATQPMDPLVPTVHEIHGNVTSAGSQPLPGIDAPELPDPAREVATERIPLEVSLETTRLVTVLAWASPQNLTDLDLALIAPNGTTYDASQGAPGDPDSPAFVNATAIEGTWTIEVESTAAAEQPFRVLAIELRPAYDLEDLREGRQALEDLGPMGDRMDQLAPTVTVDVPVAGIVSSDGKGGFTGEPAVFASLDQLQEMLDREGEVNVLRTSNPGDAREGLEHTEDIAPLLEEALEATQQAHPEPSVQALTVETSKQDIVDRAEQAGSDFTRFLTTLSSFTIVAGLLLVVNLFTMLGQERRVEMSVMRAMGMQRRHLVGATTLEGGMYALPAAPIGAVCGLGLAYVLIESINRFVVGPDALPIPFVVDESALVWAAVLGFLFTVLVVAATGWRLSRLHIASGLKNREDPSSRSRARPALWLALFGVVATALHVPTGFYTLLLLGPSALIAAGLLWVGRSWRRRTAYFVASTAIVAYGLWTVMGLDLPPSEAPYMVPIRGVLLVLMGVVALINLPGLETALSWVSTRLGSFSPAALVAASYPTRRQLRTGLTASMFALILLVLIFFSTFFTVFEVDPEREAGGYDVYAETQLPVEGLEAWSDANLETSPGALEQIEDEHALPMARVVGGGTVTIDGDPPHYNGPPIDVFYGVTPRFAEENGYELVSRAPAYGSDRAAYQAVQEDPASVIVSRVYDVDETGRLGHVDGGETLTLELGTRSYEFAVLGAQSQQYLGGIFLEPTTVQDLFPQHGTALLLTTPAEDPTQVARELERDFAELGLTAEDIRQETREIQQLNARFYTVLQVFLGLGLVIGVASLGIVTAKSALEREHELGILRAMGLPPRHIKASLVLEGLLTALLGILPGVVIGIAAAYASYVAFFQAAGVEFSIPWLSILALSLFSLAATLASTIPPAKRAAGVDTAKAVRIEM